MKMSKPIRMALSSTNDRHEDEPKPASDPFRSPHPPVQFSQQVSIRTPMASALGFTHCVSTHTALSGTRVSDPF